MGSSPLTRGKPRTVDGRNRSRRLIPAHAGKTVLVSTGSAWRLAHPRSRGENIKAAVSVVVEWGSSPLTRGKPTGEAPPTVSRAAHPRSRGENLGGVVKERAGRGSSPLTRGKREGCRLMPPWTRLIPAHAGKTSKKGHKCSPPKAHPRSRGENRAFFLGGRNNLGSSPLTRGKPSRWPLRHRAARLIPAHAGKTQEVAAERAAITAHPRSRGENMCGYITDDAVLGSSPLTRGKLADVILSLILYRLIPAHAGKTRS